MQSSLLKDIFFSLERDFIKSPSHFVFSADNVPVSTAELAINNLVIKIGTHRYGSYTVNFVDMLSWSAEKDTYRHIAYLMLSKNIPPRTSVNRCPSQKPILRCQNHHL
jgi:hypothetical protein